MNETDLAAAVVAHLSDLGWDVHQEVGSSGPRADIIAARGALLYAVEVKQVLGLDVVGQAMEWRDRCHLVSVAVPAYRKQRRQGASVALFTLIRDQGIGILEIHHNDYGFRPIRDPEWEVRETLRPALRRKVDPHYSRELRESLCDGTRTFAAAGNADGKFWSPFKATVAEIQNVLKNRPGLTTRELIAAIQHHYRSDSTARSALPKWLAAGKIPGVRGEGERPMRWYLAA